MAPAIGVALAAAGVFLSPSTAEAQIFSWRDDKGTVVLSDRPPSDADAAADLTILVPERTTATADPVGAMPAARRFAFAAPARSAAFDRLIASHASNYGVRPELVRAVIGVESGFNPRAVSPKGAMGLMQLMPATAGDLGVVDAFDPDDNIRGGVAYLRQLLDRYEHNEELALAAYNAGPAAVERHGNRVPPYRETIDYVSRIRTATLLSVPPTAPARFVFRLSGTDQGAIPRYSTVKPPAGQFGVAGAMR